jgi:hypothetical protein
MRIISSWDDFPIIGDEEYEIAESFRHELRTIWDAWEKKGSVKVLVMPYEERTDG